MKKVILLLSLFIILSCNKNEETGNNTFIVTSFYPLYIMTQNITKGTPLQVQNMASPKGQHLHDYQLTPANLKQLRQASALVVNGYGMETFLERVQKLYPKLPIIVASRTLNEANLYHTDEVNGHFWLSVPLVMQQVNTIAEDLAALNPENSDKLLQNAQEYNLTLQDLWQLMQQQLAPYKGREVILFHEGLSYVANDFGFKVLQVFEHNEDSGLSPVALATLIETVKQNPKVVLLADTQYPSRLLQLITGQTGKSPVLLNLAVSGENNLESYQDIMLYNVTLLQQGFTE